MNRNYCTKEHTPENQEQARQKLLELCPRGTTVYCFVTALNSHSTPRYEMAVIRVYGGVPDLENITAWIHIFTGWRYYDCAWTTNGIQCQGNYHDSIVANLSDRLYNDRAALIAVKK